MSKSLVCIAIVTPNILCRKQYTLMIFIPLHRSEFKEGSPAFTDIQLRKLVDRVYSSQSLSSLPTVVGGWTNHVKNGSRELLAVAFDPHQCISLRIEFFVLPYPVHKYLLFIERSITHD